MLHTACLIPLLFEVNILNCLWFFFGAVKHWAFVRLEAEAKHVKYFVRLQGRFIGKIHELKSYVLKNILK